MGSVVSVHSEMRAVRVARQIRQKKLSRLEVNSVESRAQEIGAGQGKQGGISVAELQDAAKAAAAARGKHRGPTEDIIHYFTLMSSELHYLDIIPKIENLH